VTSRQDKAARVFVDYSQFWVAGGSKVTIGGEIVPHLLLDLGPQAVAVLTGLHSGTLTVTARILPAAPAEVDSNWEVDLAGSGRGPASASGLAGTGADGPRASGQAEDGHGSRDG
jgi:hypothetical protein